MIRLISLLALGASTHTQTSNEGLRPCAVIDRMYGGAILRDARAKRVLRGLERLESGQTDRSDLLRASLVRPGVRVWSGGLWRARACVSVGGDGFELEVGL